MKIVTNGEHYAIEMRFLFIWKRYLDLVHPQHSWTPGDLYFKDCLTSDLNKVCRILKEQNWKFRPLRRGKDSMSVEYVQFIVSNKLAELAELFQPGTKLTFISRNPDVSEGHMVITDDDLAEIEKVIQKVKSK